jgi:5-methylcytosine-specific restriction endonuclease McrA
MSIPLLVLNKHYLPIGTSSWERGMVGFFSGSFQMIDIWYEQKEDGSFDLNSVEAFYAIKDWDSWRSLEIRPCDRILHTSSGPVRRPVVLLCAAYDKMAVHKAIFPTKRNVWKRDGYICQYSGKRLSRNELSVDHILPSSRGGLNTWENLVTCDREINSRKGDKTPEEIGLKLLNKPVKPKGGMVFSDVQSEWESFLWEGSPESSFK